MKVTPLAVLVLNLLLVLPGFAARGKGNMENPDFTKGDRIPEGATHDWTLGATGARGWMYSNRLETSDARQIAITKVDKGSPADGVLEVGDVILGVAGKPFSYDPRTEFGKALTFAESNEGRGELSVIRWRDGVTKDVVVQLPVLGNYSATAPFDCPKSKRILELGCEALAKRMEAPNYGKQSAITRSLNALALLASGEEKYMPMVKKEAEWASNFSSKGMATWYYGYVIAFLAEYHMATGDDSVMPGLERLALEAANGQSMVGSWGHGFAKEDGRLGGYGMMNAPGVPLTTSLVLAREAGVDGLDLAIERSLKLLRFYIGKGSVPYGDHAPWIQNHDGNGKNSMAAVLFSLIDEEEGARYFSKMSLACHGNERDTGHTGNFWNMTWAMPGVVQSGPNATGAWMKEFGSWYYDLARRWDGAFPHQGPPAEKGDKTKNWDATGAYLLAYAMPLKKLMITGKQGSGIPPLSAEEAEKIVEDGKGWSNNHRYEFYDALSDEELIGRLDSWSPVVRERAAIAIDRRKDASPFLPVLIEMLGAAKIEARYGACQTLAKLGEQAAPAIPALRECLKHEDLWLRVKAAEALANMGKPGMVALPELLTMLAKGPSAEDPRAMEQRYLCFYVFGDMLRKSSLDGVDLDALRIAIVAGLQNQDGRARGAISSMYGKLSYEEIEPLLPAIHEAIVTPSPSGIMFSNQIRLAGLKLLAKHKIKEGIPLCIDIMNIHEWGKKNRIGGCLDALESYGVAAKSQLPRLRELEKQLIAHREAKMLAELTERLQSIIQELENSSGTVELRSIRD